MDNQQFGSFLKMQEEILKTLKQIQKNQFDMMYLITRSKYGSHTTIGYCNCCNENVAKEGSQCIYCNNIVKLKLDE